MSKRIKKGIKQQFGVNFEWELMAITGTFFGWILVVACWLLLFFHLITYTYIYIVRLRVLSTFVFFCLFPLLFSFRHIKYLIFGNFCVRVGISATEQIVPVPHKNKHNEKNVRRLSLQQTSNRWNQNPILLHFCFFLLFRRR